MTKVVYKKKDDFFEIITIKGHANFSTKGDDIVCAGISSIVEGSYSFFNTYHSDLILLEKKNAKISFIPLKNDNEIQTCLTMMFHQLENISHFYPRYLSFNYKD
ncbi:MAG: hypothetical protein AM1032_000171 [Mycoplasmataceae bacterium]|nr:MAG: hypothetical protein AM1032_000171 [Mycoplasmataceae bacterium]